MVHSEHTLPICPMDPLVINQKLKGYYLILILIKKEDCLVLGPNSSNNKIKKEDEPKETRILEHNATKSNNRNTTVDDKEVVEKESKDSETIVEEDKSSDIGRNDETSNPGDRVFFGLPFVEITKLILDMEQGLITFTDGIKEVTFKTPYRDSEMDDLTSEGHDLLSSMVILSEDDYRRGCKRPSTLKSRFCKDIDKLGLIYKKEIERIDLDVSFEARGSRTSEGGVT
ncbi:hypothetical protein Tco_0920704 [Tanacetum coccineum]